MPKCQRFHKNPPALYYINIEIAKAFVKAFQIKQALALLHTETPGS
jgi:hypothetical protein